MKGWPCHRFFSLEADGSFGQNQRLFRTTAFGEDLDDRPGLAFRVRTDKPGRFNAQLAWIDNRGDRTLHGQEYAWHTRFWLAGGFFRVTESFEMMVELNARTHHHELPRHALGGRGLPGCVLAGVIRYRHRPLVAAP